MSEELTEEEEKEVRIIRLRGKLNSLIEEDKDIDSVEHGTYIVGSHAYGSVGEQLDRAFVVALDEAQEVAEALWYFANNTGKQTRFSVLSKVIYTEEGELASIIPVSEQQAIEILIGVIKEEGSS